MHSEDHAGAEARLAGLIAVRASERGLLYANWRRAIMQDDPALIAATYAAITAAQDAHMDALFPNGISNSEPLITRPPMPRKIRHALGTLIRDFDRQFSLKLAETGALEIFNGAALEQWIDPRPNPWRSMVVRQILNKLLPELMTSVESYKKKQIDSRVNLFIRFMTSRQLIAVLSGDRFNATMVMHGFLAELGQDSVERLFNSPQTAASHFQTLSGIWANWQKSWPLNLYHGDVGDKPRVGAPCKPRQETPIVKRSWSDPDAWERWAGQLSVTASAGNDIAEKAEQRAIRIVRQKMGLMKTDPAFESWRWGMLRRSSSGGWNVDPRMHGSLVAVDDTYERNGFTVPAIQTAAFTLELPRESVGLLFAPPEQWEDLLNAGLIDPIKSPEAMRAIDQISLGAILKK